MSLTEEFEAKAERTGRCKSLRGHRWTHDSVRLAVACMRCDRVVTYEQLAPPAEQTIVAAQSSWLVERAADMAEQAKAFQEKVAQAVIDSVLLTSTLVVDPDSLT